jgi:hypothetical protein
MAETSFTEVSVAVAVGECSETIKWTAVPKAEAARVLKALATGGMVNDAIERICGDSG